MTLFHNVKADTLVTICSEILQKHDVPDDEALIVASSLVDADLRGVSSHGVIRLPIYLSRLENGVTPNSAKVEVVKETDNTAVLDGGQSLGQVVSQKAIDVLLEKSDIQTFSAVSVRNSNHFGAAAYWAMQIQEKDMIGFALSNVEPIMPPPGGAAARVGNNPISIVVPTGGSKPIVLDMATSTVPLGKVLNAKSKGEALPEGWAVDSEGKPTTDPDKVVDGGFLFPVGGPKGYGLAIIVDILSALLSGGAIGKEIHSMYQDINNPNRVSHFFMAIKIEAFIDKNLFFQSINRYIQLIKDTPHVEGISAIFLPGEIEYLNKKKNTIEGISLPDSVYSDLVNISKKVNLNASLISELEMSL